MSEYYIELVQKATKKIRTRGSANRINDWQYYYIQSNYIYSSCIHIRLALNVNDVLKDVQSDEEKSKNYIDLSIIHSYFSWNVKINSTFVLITRCIFLHYFCSKMKFVAGLIKSIPCFVNKFSTEWTSLRLFGIPRISNS